MNKYYAGKHFPVCRTLSRESRSCEVCFCAHSIIIISTCTQTEIHFRYSRLSRESRKSAFFLCDVSSFCYYALRFRTGSCHCKISILLTISYMLFGGEKPECFHRLLMKFFFCSASVLIPIFILFIISGPIVQSPVYPQRRLYKTRQDKTWQVPARLKWGHYKMRRWLKGRKDKTMLFSFLLPVFHCYLRFTNASRLGKSQRKILMEGIKYFWLVNSLCMWEGKGGNS